MHTTNGEVSGCPTPRPGGGWFLLLILAAVQFNHIVDFTIMMPLETSYQRDLDITTHQFSLLVSVYAFSACLSGLLAASLVDRFDRKRALLFLFAGIARPTSFEALVRSAGASVVGSRWFPDHHRYSSAGLTALRHAAAAQGATRLLTTEKDLMRIPASEREAPPSIEAVPIDLRILSGEDALVSALDFALGARA